MPTTEQRLVTVIEADAACQTHFGASPATRVYPLTLPQTPTLPAATYQRIGGVRVDSFDGIDGMDDGLYQIDVYATTMRAAREAADALRDALDNSAAMGAVFQAVRFDFENDVDPRLYRVSMDVQLMTDES